MLTRADFPGGSGPAACIIRAPLPEGRAQPAAGGRRRGGRGANAVPPSRWVSPAAGLLHAARPRTPALGVRPWPLGAPRGPAERSSSWPPDALTPAALSQCPVAAAARRAQNAGPAPTGLPARVSLRGTRCPRGVGGGSRGVFSVGCEVRPVYAVPLRAPRLPAPC